MDAAPAPELHFWDAAGDRTSSELQTGRSCLMHFTCAYCHILLKQWPNDTLFLPLPVVCSAELPRFLCSSLAQAPFPRIRHPATSLFYPDTHTHFSGNVVLSTSHCLPSYTPVSNCTHSSQVWAFPGDSVPGGIQPHEAAEHFQVKLSTYFSGSMPWASSSTGPRCLVLAPGPGLWVWSCSQPPPLLAIPLPIDAFQGLNPPLFKPTALEWV